MQRKIICFSYRRATKEEIASNPTDAIVISGNTSRQLRTRGSPVPMIHEVWFEGDDPVTMQDCIDCSIFVTKTLSAIFLATRLSKG